MRSLLAGNLFKDVMIEVLKDLICAPVLHIKTQPFKVRCLHVFNNCWWCEQLGVFFEE